MYMTFIRQICGFLIQIMPCAFFCLFPFAGSFKASPKKTVFAVSVMLAGISLIFAGVTLYRPYFSTDTYDSYDICSRIQETIFFLTLLILLLIYIFSMNAYISQKIFVFSITMHYGFLISLLTDFMLYYFKGDAYKTGSYKYTPSALMSYFFITALLFYPMYKLAARIRKSLKSILERHIWQQFAVLPALSIILAVFAFQIAISHALSPDVFMINLLIILIMTVFSLFTNYYILRMLDMSEKNAMERSRLENALNNYRLSAKNVHRIHEIRHEVTHHINALSLYMKNKDYSGAQSYLDRYSETAEEIRSAEYTLHPLLNAMLADYKERTRQLHICFTCQISVPGSIAISDTDLCCLLSNMLDNAIDGCQNIEESKRWMKLVIRKNGQFLYFSCKIPAIPGF